MESCQTCVRRLELNRNQLILSGVDENLTRDKTARKSDALLTKEKPSLEKSVEGAKLLEPCTSSSVTETTSISSKILQGESIVNRGEWL